jgi:hypothetical protein
VADLQAAHDVDVAGSQFHFLAFIQACAKEPPERTLRLEDFSALPEDAVAVCL